MEPVTYLKPGKGFVKDPAAVSLGRRGGKAGTGDAKKRSPEHYRRMAEIRKQNRERQKEQ